MNPPARHFRVRIENATQVPLHSANYNPRLGFGGLIAILVIPVFMAFVAETVTTRVWMAMIALAFVALVFFMAVWINTLAERRVRLSAVGGGIRFRCSDWLGVWSAIAFFVIAAAGVLAALLPVYVSSEPIGLGRWGPAAVGALGLGGLVLQLWWLLTPAGLTLDRNGLVGVRGTARVDLAWEDLTSVEVVDHKGAKLVLNLSTGGAIRIEPRWTGSDPNVLAPIIDHFRRNPDDRHLLADPNAALYRVEQANSAD